MCRMCPNDGFACRSPIQYLVMCKQTVVDVKGWQLSGLEDGHLYFAVQQPKPPTLFVHPPCSREFSVSLKRRSARTAPNKLQRPKKEWRFVQQAREKISLPQKRRAVSTRSILLLREALPKTRVRHFYSHNLCRCQVEMGRAEGKYLQRLTAEMTGRRPRVSISKGEREQEKGQAEKYTHCDRGFVLR